MQTLILGFDSFDPVIFERLVGEGRLPHLARHADAGRYARLQVSDPPQTEVSWTSIATGADPGTHGIFDFVHRDPASYLPYVSLLPTRSSRVGVQFTPPVQANTIFEEAARLGYPATSLWWPATFPARPELPVNTIPGLGTPDLLGRLGVGAVYTTEVSRNDADSPKQKTPRRSMIQTGKGRFTAVLEGPMAKKGDQARAATVEMRLEVNDDQTARLVIGGQALTLRPGVWSPIVEVPFKMGMFFTLRAVTRILLTQTQPEVRLYLLPLQIHPLASPWRYATPPSFVKRIWKTCGPFLTIGWPQDTTGLEEDCMNDAQFLALCESISAGREAVLMHLLDSFQEGVMATIFDSLDRVQHMFRRDRPDAVEDWYVRLDGLVGRVEKRLKERGQGKARLLVLSDHGFADFKHKVHLNRWLLDNHFLLPKNGNESGGVEDADWGHSQAYAVGLNSIYVNLAGREGQGSVSEAEYPAVIERLCAGLLNWRDDQGKPVVQRVLRREEAFSGPLVPYGPDLLVGYAPGYRASSETGLGQWKTSVLEANRDHWGGDHCIDSQAVPGVILCNHGLQGLEKPSYRDVPRLAIGKALEHKNVPPPQPPAPSSGEGKEVIEERLKSLGYL